MRSRLPRPHRIVLVLKKSPYQIYFLEQKNRLFLRHRAGEEDALRMKDAHAEHLRTVQAVESEVRSCGLPYRVVYRADRFKCRPFELVITVGGDGTFLEASHHITTQLILGINSDPARSVGHFCVANRKTFRNVLITVLAGDCRIRKFNRMILTRNGKALGVSVLNELLIAHVVPAAMSRYRLRIGKVEEEQRSSGIWISTAAGSTAAIRSAGGKPMPETSKKLQYLPRELFAPAGKSYALRGGILPARAAVEITSLMREGRCYVDGSHFRMELPYGDRLQIRNSPYPLLAVASS